MKLRNSIASIAVAGTLATMSLVPANAAALFFNFSAVFTPVTGGASNIGSYVGNVMNIGSLSQETVLNGSDFGGLEATNGGSDINVTRFGPTSSTSSVNEAYTLDYTVAVTLTPTDSTGTALAGVVPMTQTQNGTGHVTGTIRQNAANTITATGFSVPLHYSFLSATGESLNYDVFFKSYTGFPSPTSTTSFGAIQYHVVGVAVPEPGAVAMFAGMGVSASLFALKLRKRRK